MGPTPNPLYVSLPVATVSRRALGRRKTSEISPMKRAELVFLPVPGVGHLTSTLKFATQLLDRDRRFSVTILVMHMSKDGETPLSLLPSNSEHIRFVRLPPVDPPPLELFSKSIEKFVSVLIESYKTHVKNAIVDHVLSASNAAPIAGLVLDLFFTSMIDVGRELGLPSYIFFTSGAAFLGFMLYLEARHQQGGAEYEESDPESLIPSYIHPVPTKVLPAFAFNKEGGYISMVEHAQKFKEVKGIIINTFAELEPHAVNSLTGYEIPPIYTVGPVIDLKGEHRRPSDENRARKIMDWLDDQPPSSVVFLCFGSAGSFSPPQVREIAKGLENSGKRFLWSLRRPPGTPDMGQPSDYDDYEEVLPAGFMERTKERGIICGWVAQVEVLGHEAVGGFVSHCGWNSILESVWNGVPMVAWPLYAEQQLNAFELVRDLGLAVEMRIDYRKDGGEVVGAEQIERAVRCVMDGDGEVRRRVKEVSVKSRNALSDGGSSYASMGELIADMSANV